MGPLENAVLGIVFVAVGGAATLLMYFLWGFPFDHATLKSEAPPRLVRVHRMLGYLFAAIYVAFMAQMLPRLWGDQIELPARSVVHLALAIAAGAALLLKILVVQFYKHMEPVLAPALGTFVMISAVVMIGLSAPVALRESWTARSGGIFNETGAARVRAGLTLAGLQDAARAGSLASPRELRAGRRVLGQQCTGCHDLRTVLARPREARAWRDTVERMAARTAPMNAMREQDCWRVTAYLIALSPQLQHSVKLQLAGEETQRTALRAAETLEPAAPAEFDYAGARAIAEAKCSQCHALNLLQAKPKRQPEEIRALVRRMVNNGLSADAPQLGQITRYLTQSYGT
jgi:mono/diheme cytochrome c family protein